MLYSRTSTTEIGKETRIKWGKSDQLTHTRILEALKAGDAIWPVISYRIG